MSDRCAGGSGACTPSRRGGKKLQVKVYLLDESLHNIQISGNSLGSELYNATIERIKLLEADYFDLEYMNGEEHRCWLDHTKPIIRQVTSTKDLIFYLAVKFYTPYPNLLEEEYTRYLFALQIKRDLIGGALTCSTSTMALLASFIVQAEIGDFMEEEYEDLSYLRPLKILPSPQDDILDKVVEFHKQHIGMTPEEADFNLLDTSRKVEYYGVHMTPAKDHEGLSLCIAVTHLGVIVFQNLTKINTFSWAKIRKLSFKRKRFLIKLHPEGFGYYKDTVEFYFDSRDECKRFWKKCIEHHAFFRCLAAMKSSSKKPKVVSKGSSYRYIGRTQKELEEYVRENSTKRPHFERPSKRRTSKSPSGNRSTGSHAYYPQQARPHSAHSAHSQPMKSSRQTASSTASYNMNASIYSAPSRAVSEGDQLERNGADISPPPTVNEQLTDVIDYRSEDEAPGANKAKRRRSEQQRLQKQAEVAQSDGLVYDPSQDNKVDSPDYPAPCSVISNVVNKPTSRRQSSTSHRDSVRSNASRHSRETHDPTSKHRERGDPHKLPNTTNQNLRDQHKSMDSPGSVNKPRSQLTKNNKIVANNVPHQPNSLVNADSNTIGRIVCIDQYSSSDSDSLLGTRHPRSKSTPCSVHSNSVRESVRDKKQTSSMITDALDAETDLLLSDIPYVLLRRHISPDKTSRSERSASSGHRRSKRSPHSLASSGGHSRSLASHRTTTSDGQIIRQSRSLDRKLAALLPPKSPKLLREEYLQKQRNQVDHATIEALKAELRSAGQALSAPRNGRSRVEGGRSMVVGRTTEFVSAYRLPAVNNFSAKDDTMSPQIESMALLYRKKQKKRDTNGDRKVLSDSKQVKNKRSSDSLSDKSVRNIGDESPPCLPPRNPVYLDSTDSSDDSSCDRRSRPQSVSDVDVSLRTPRSARKQIFGGNGSDEFPGKERGRKRLKKKAGMFAGAAHAARIAGSMLGRDSETADADDISTEDEIESSWGSSFSSLDDQLSGVNVLQDEPDVTAPDQKEDEKKPHDISDTSSSSMRGQAESPSSSQPPFPSEALSAQESFPPASTISQEEPRPASRPGSKPISSSTSGDELRVRGHHGHIDMSTASSSNGGLIGEEISSESDDAEFLVEERSRDPSISSQLDHMAKPDSVKSSGGSNSAASSEKLGRNKSRDEKSKKSCDTTARHMVPPGLMVTCPSPSPEPPKLDKELEVSENVQPPPPEATNVDDDPPKCERQDSIDLEKVPFPEDQTLPPTEDFSSIPLPDPAALADNSENESAELAKLELSATLGELEKVTEEVLQSLMSPGEEESTNQEASRVTQNSPVNYLAEISSNNLIGGDNDNVTSIQSDHSSQAVDEVEPGASMSTVKSEGPEEQFVGGPEAYPEDFDATCGSLTSTPSLNADEEDVTQRTKFLAERNRNGASESLGVLPEKLIEKEVALIEESCMDVASDTDVSCLVTVSDSESLSKHSPTSKTDSPLVLQGAISDSPTRRNVAANLVEKVISGAISRLEEEFGSHYPENLPESETSPKQIEINDSDSSPAMEMCDLASALEEEMNCSDVINQSQSNQPPIQYDSITNILPKRELSKVSEDTFEEETEEGRDSDVSPLSPEAVDSCRFEQDVEGTHVDSNGGALNEPSRDEDSSDTDAEQEPHSLSQEETKEDTTIAPSDPLETGPEGVISPCSPQHVAPMSLGITSAVVDMPLSPTANESRASPPLNQLPATVPVMTSSTSSSDKEDSSIEISSSSSDENGDDDDEPGPTGAASQSRAHKYRHRRDPSSSSKGDQKDETTDGKNYRDDKDQKKHKKSSKACAGKSPGESTSYSTHDMYETHFENSCENSVSQTARASSSNNNTQSSNYHQQNQHFLEDEDEGENGSPPPADEMALLAMRTLQETLEGNLFCGDSSEYTTSRPPSLEEEEYVLSEDEEVNDMSSSDDSDSDKSSASEGSEDIEPFPPPPPELLEEELPESVLEEDSLMPLEESKSEHEQSQPIRLSYSNRHVEERRQRRTRNRDVRNGDSILNHHVKKPDGGHR